MVRTRNDAPGAIVISVEDTGVGISAEALPQIFNAFDQGDWTGQHRYGGLGLGLAISKAIVELHGGTTRAESKGTGQGAIFAVLLTTVTEPATEVPAETKPRQSTRSLRILIVEDHEATNTVLSRLLTRSGHRTALASNIEQALDQYAKERFDVVISDLGLPDGSGLDLMPQLQRQRPVLGIALSGYGMESDLQKSRKAGFCAHLVKPVNFDELQRLLHDIASQSDPISKKGFLREE